MTEKVAHVRHGDDQVAVAIRPLAAGSRLVVDGAEIVLAAHVPKGHRFAVRDIPEGEYIRQFGYPFARSGGIARGELITPDNSAGKIPVKEFAEFIAPPSTPIDMALAERTFRGYRRGDGRVGTRNYYLVVPTSMCASETARLVAAQLEAAVANQFPGIDGIVAIPHTEGCGCAATGQIDRLLTVLKGFVGHPNVAGCMIIDLGCEQTNYPRVHAALAETIAHSCKPVDWLTIQESGGTRQTVQKAIEMIHERLPAINSFSRQPAPISALLIGTECGASDSFSGISANPLIGAAVDKVIYGGGAAIMSEIPEMLGTFDMLFPRFRSVRTAENFREAVSWYLSLAEKLGLDISDNVVPKNIEGGLINCYLKSIGAVLKGGTTAIEEVIGYGEPVVKKGLSIMQGPGADTESVTGLVSSGANLICFSTGFGAVTGSAICPVIKISSTTDLYDRLRDDIDFDAGVLLENAISLDDLSDSLLELIIDVASGRETATERNRQRQFQVWTAGKLSL